MAIVDMEQLWQSRRRAIIGAALALAAVAASAIVVPETQQAVIMRLGQPVRVLNRYAPDQDFGQTGAGLFWHIPLLEHVVWVDKRVLAIDLDRQRVITRDQRQLDIDADAHFRVINPLRLSQTAGSTDHLGEQLQPVLAQLLRQELGRRAFTALFTAERGQALDALRLGLDRAARAYGARVIDVQIRHADLPDGTARDAAETDMAAARSQDAATIRAEGLKNAEIIRADAEAQAAQTYAASFGKDPDFYDFYRAMQSYDITFAQKGSQTMIVLGPDDGWLRQFRGNPGAAKRK